MLFLGLIKKSSVQDNRTLGCLLTCSGVWLKCWFLFKKNPKFHFTMMTHPSSENELYGNDNECPDCSPGIKNSTGFDRQYLAGHISQLSVLCMGNREPSPSFHCPAVWALSRAFVVQCWCLSQRPDVLGGIFRILRTMKPYCIEHEKLDSSGNQLWVSGHVQQLGR